VTENSTGLGSALTSVVYWPGSILINVYNRAWAFVQQGELGVYFAALSIYDDLPPFVATYCYAIAYTSNRRGLFCDPLALHCEAVVHCFRRTRLNQ